MYRDHDRAHNDRKPHENCRRYQYINNKYIEREGLENQDQKLFTLISIFIYFTIIIMHAIEKCNKSWNERSEYHINNIKNQIIEIIYVSLDYR